MKWEKEFEDRFIKIIKCDEDDGGMWEWKNIHFLNIVDFIKDLLRKQRENLGKVEFCDDCEYLDPTENKQTIAKEPHWCKLFNLQVNHYGYHPKLPRLAMCKSFTKQFIEKIPEPEYEEKI